MKLYLILIPGTVCQFVWTFTSFPLLILMVILMGLFVGSRVSLLPLVCTEVVGSERMPQAYSISAMSTALVGAMWSPILGLCCFKLTTNFHTLYENNLSQNYQFSMQIMFVNSDVTGVLRNYIQPILIYK